MLKTFLAVLLFIVPAGLSLAQTLPTGNIKVYSGDLQLYPTHQVGKVKQLPHGHCTIEFKSTIPFTTMPASQVPSAMTYTITFESTIFEKFLIKIHTNDDQEFTIDPAAEPTPVGPDGEHKMFDTYVVYLFLSPDKIDRVEVVDPTGGVGKYVMLSSEIR